MRAMVLAWLLAAAVPAAAQDESRFMADLRKEAESLSECGDLEKIAGCATTLATAFPFHVALGSVAPQNGFGFGPAFVEHFTPNENWRLGWNTDAVFTPAGASRVGAYMKIVRTKRD